MVILREKRDVRIVSVRLSLQTMKLSLLKIQQFYPLIAEKYKVGAIQYRLIKVAWQH